MSDITKFAVTNTGFMLCQAIITPQAGSTINGRDFNQGLTIDVDSVTGLTQSDAAFAFVDTGAIPITVSGGSGSYGFKWKWKDTLGSHDKFAINSTELASPTISTRMPFGVRNNCWEVQVFDAETMLSQKQLVFVQLIHTVNLGGGIA